MTGGLFRKVRRRGRPSQTVGRQLTDHIIEIAKRLFSEKGFEQTSIDLVITTAQISKQTFYSRFNCKEGLFDAVMKKDLDDLIKPYTEHQSSSVSFESHLIALGVELSRRASIPAAAELNRLIIGEFPRFPELAAIYRDNCSYAVSLIANMFSCFEIGKSLEQSNLFFISEQFLYTVTNQPLHKATRLEQNSDGYSRVESCVRLFLRGAIAIDRS